MISRRNIRVKVMQALYTAATLEDSRPGEPKKILLKHFDQTRSLLVYLIWFLTEVARYAEKDSHKRAGKHLPSEDDLHVNTKIAGNEVLWRILEDASFDAQTSIDKPFHQADPELIRRIYQQLTETKEYTAYINASSREKADEKKILEFIVNDLMLPSEAFISHIEELYSNWDDDGEMVVQLLHGYLVKPGSINFSQLMSPDKEQFSRSLLDTVISKKEYLQELIVPKLKNWDPERIALLDMILMEMGVSEFLYFDTIPPKVTINEYIDLAKDYSTAQSGQFVNGILDSIHKDLVADGKMEKTDHRKI